MLVVLGHRVSHVCSAPTQGSIIARLLSQRIALSARWAVDGVLGNLRAMCIASARRRAEAVITGVATKSGVVARTLPIGAHLATARACRIWWIRDRGWRSDALILRGGIDRTDATWTVSVIAVVATETFVDAARAREGIAAGIGKLRLRFGISLCPASARLARVN